MASTANKLHGQGATFHLCTVVVVTKQMDTGWNCIFPLSQVFNSEGLIVGLA